MAYGSGGHVGVMGAGRGARWTLQDGPEPDIQMVAICFRGGHMRACDSRQAAMYVQYSSQAAFEAGGAVRPSSNGARGEIAEISGGHWGEISEDIGRVQEHPEWPMLIEKTIAAI